MDTGICIDISITGHRMLPIEPLPLLPLGSRIYPLSAKPEYIFLWQLPPSESASKTDMGVSNWRRLGHIFVLRAKIKLEKWVSGFHSERSTHWVEIPLNLKEIKNGEAKKDGKYPL